MSLPCRPVRIKENVFFYNDCPLFTFDYKCRIADDRVAADEFHGCCLLRDLALAAVRCPLPTMSYHDSRYCCQGAELCVIVCDYAGLLYGLTDRNEFVLDLSFDLLERLACQPSP